MTSMETRTARGRGVYVSPTPFDEHRVGAAAVYCSDGRYGEQMDEFLHQGLGLPRYDRVAMPGGAACMAGHAMTYYEQTALEQQLEFLIREHALRRIILIAHEGCGFYKKLWTGWGPIEHQREMDLEKAGERIRLWNAEVKVEPYFARKVDGKVVFERWGAAARQRAGSERQPAGNGNGGGQQPASAPGHG